MTIRLWNRRPDTASGVNEDPTLRRFLLLLERLEGRLPEGLLGSTRLEAESGELRVALHAIVENLYEFEVGIDAEEMSWIDEVALAEHYSNRALTLLRTCERHTT